MSTQEQIDQAARAIYASDDPLYALSELGIEIFEGSAVHEVVDLPKGPSTTFYAAVRFPEDLGLSVSFTRTTHFRRWTAAMWDELRVGEQIFDDAVFIETEDSQKLAPILIERCQSAILHFISFRKTRIRAYGQVLFISAETLGSGAKPDPEEIVVLAAHFAQLLMR